MGIVHPLQRIHAPGSSPVPPPPPPAAGSVWAWRPSCHTRWHPLAKKERAFARSGGATPRVPTQRPRGGWWAIAPLLSALTVAAHARTPPLFPSRSMPWDPRTYHVVNHGGIGSTPPHPTYARGSLPSRGASASSSAANPAAPAAAKRSNTRTQARKWVADVKAITAPSPSARSTRSTPASGKVMPTQRACLSRGKAGVLDVRSTAATSHRR